MPWRVSSFLLSFQYYMLCFTLHFPYCSEDDFTNTDYCVFDVYGEGYFVPTDSPTAYPTVTMRPSITPLPPRPLSFLGSTPPADKLPLQICEGDCDNDQQCGEGLICFQREENMAVPGCIGNDSNKTDYCILDPHGDGYTFPPTGSPQPSGAPFVRPTGPAKSIENLGWEPPTPMDECQGDCDEDSDCGPHLYCFQRNNQFETVPGCLGGEGDSTLTDYCTYRDQEPTSPPVPTAAITPSPTASPTIQPTVAPVPTPAPTMGPYTKGEIKFLGWTPDKPILDQCEGDCDKDEHCAPGLLCYNRQGQYDPVPGCDGAELDDSLSDFCFDPRVYDTAAPTDGTTAPSAATPSPTGAPSKTSNSPTKDPSAAPNTPEPTYDPIQRLCQTNQKCLQQGLGGYCCPMQNGVFRDCCDATAPTDFPSAMPVTDDVSTPAEGLPQVNFIAWSPPPNTMPLKACEGDCDIDRDCGDGLECYQRYEQNENVPGCSGGNLDDSLADYCAPIGSTTQPTAPSPTEKPTADPSKAPTSNPTPGRFQTNGVPPAIDCRSEGFDDVNFNRMCKEDSCCSNPRKEGGFCEKMYTILGDSVESACHHCCIESPAAGFPREVGPTAAVNPNIPKTVVCDNVGEVYKTCKADSCCDGGENSKFCKGQFALYPNDMESICVS